MTLDKGEATASRSRRALEEVWAEVSPLLDEALALPPETRDDWLAALAERNPEAAFHVRGCLDDLTALRQQRFLDGEPPAAMTGATLVGQRIGAYTLERRIGYGGMGTVWLAHRSDGRFEGSVAVKLLNPSLIGHPTEQRFVREGAVLARLHHPHIAHLMDAGVAGGSQPYLVLEYVEGERIDAYCERRDLTLEQRIRLFLDALAAVAHAHRALIVHRDLKPSNIFVTVNGAVKLLDFGVAALLAPEASEAELTRLAAPGLTPEYAAPEQLRGEPVTTATDVYALGLVLFVLLAGRPPVIADGKTAGELVQATLEQDAPAPSQVAIDARRGRLLRGDLDNIIAKALRKEATERYSTVELFAQDLRRYLAHEPVSARPDSVAYRAGKFVRRHRGGIASAALVGIALVGAVIVATTQMYEARRQRDDARFESRRAEATSDFMGTLLMSDGGPDRPALTPTEKLERGVELLDKQYKSDPAFLGRMLVQLAHHFRGETQTRRATELYARAYEIGRSLEDRELMISAQCSHAYALALAGQREGVGERIEDAYSVMQTVRTPDAALAASCLLARAQFAARTDDLAAAENHLREAMAVLEAGDSQHRPIYVRTIVDLGGLYLRTQRPAAALGLAELAGKVHETYGRGDTSARVVSWQNAGVALGDMGEIREALAQHTRAMNRTRELEPAGREPPFYALNYAGLELRMARPQTALAAADAVLPRVRTAGHLAWLLVALRHRAEALLDLGDIDAAGATLAEARPLAAKADTVLQAQHAVLEARLALARGDAEAARNYADAALKLAGYGADKPQRMLGRVLIAAAHVALAAQSTSDAEKYASEALQRSEAVARGADTSADVGESLLVLAQARLAQGARGEAAPLLERAVRALAGGLDEQHPLTQRARALLAEAEAE